MFNFNSDDWRNALGGGGVPGLMSTNQILMQGMGLFPQQQQGVGGFGPSTSLSDLLSQMRGGDGGGMSGGGGSYVGGEGFI